MRPFELFTARGIIQANVVEPHNLSTVVTDINQPTE